MAGAKLPPAEYSAVLRGFVRAAQMPQQKITADMIALAHRASLSAPIAFEPFVIAARAEEQAGRVGRAIMLLQEAKRRRPTRTGTRAQLAIHHAKLGQNQAFLDEVDWLLRRSGRVQEQVLPQLVGVAADPASRKVLAQLLAQAPPWREQFYRVATDRRIAPQHASALVAEIRAAGAKGSMIPEYKFEMQALLAAGQYRAARAAWARTLPRPPATSDNLVMDGEFKGGPPAPPFDWILHDGDVGRASIAADRDLGPHLEVEYFGGKNAVLAEQLLTLAPGAHELQLTARSEAPPKTGSISWRLSCLPSPQQIARVNLENLTSQGQSYRARFVIPASGCTGQKLQLIAEAGDFSGSSNLAVSKMSLRRAR
jgi:hypothetical protein